MVIIHGGDWIPLRMHQTVDDFGDIVWIPGDAVKRAWYFVGIWRALENV